MRGNLSRTLAYDNASSHRTLEKSPVLRNTSGNLTPQPPSPVSHPGLRCGRYKSMCAHTMYGSLRGGGVMHGIARKGSRQSRISATYVPRSRKVFNTRRVQGRAARTVPYQARPGLS